VLAHSGSGGIGLQGKILRFPVSRRAGRVRDGGEMTIDTIFKEFVEGKGINFCTLVYGSREYRNLVKAFNRMKFRLEAEEDALEFERIRARLKLNGSYAMEEIRSSRTRRPGSGARFAAP
jgi:hypothetical protein